MCGIVGLIGQENVVSRVLQGLKRVEYRGYDSAGLFSFLEDGSYEIFKSIGKIENLQKKIGLPNPMAKTAIGHTRWATHGGITELNAHPHYSKDFACVHNGIIENATELKKELKEKGVCFYSETDTESFIHLLQYCFEEENDPIKGLLKAFFSIKGNCAFVVLNKLNGDIYSIKRNVPLVCGIGTHQNTLWVASDPYVLVENCEEVYFPEDATICHLNASENRMSFLDSKGNIIPRPQGMKLGLEYEHSSLGDFEYYTLKEIFEQPSLVQTLINRYLVAGAIQDKFLSQLREIRSLLKETSSLHIFGCGTSYHAGLLIQFFCHEYLKIPCLVHLSHEFRYGNYPVRAEDIALFLSQSGETADTFAALKMCKEKGIKTLSLVNVEGSAIYRETNYSFCIFAGPENGVASTKAFTNMSLVGLLLILGMAKRLETSEQREEKTHQLLLLKEKMIDILSRDASVKKLAESLHGKKGFLFTGRGPYYAIALEGALKLKEVAYVHAEGYASGELKHGPLALVDDQMVNISYVPRVLKDKNLVTIAEIKARQGVVVAIAQEEDLESNFDHFITVDFSDLSEDLSPLYVNVINQLFAYYMARFKGHDVDRPRNLAKSVTVE